VLRFAALGHTSFNLDELFTLGAIRSSFGGMLHVVKATEGTPPLFYAMAWTWRELFGTGEAAMRALPALLGTLTVPVMYLASRELMPRRIALVCALLVAINPMLIATSQSVRAYALAILLGALSLVFCFRALKGTSRTALPALSIIASLGLLTHYYLAFVFVGEFVVLIAGRVRRQDLMRAAVAPVVTVLAISPLALAQVSKPLEAIGNDSLALRVAQVPKDFIVAYNMPFKVVVTLIGCSFALLALVLLFTRAPASVRQAGWIPLSLAAFVLVAPLAMAPFGVDLFVTRSVSVAVLPILILLAAGLASGRVGWAALVGLSAVSLIPTIARDVDSRYGGLDDFRGAIRAMGPPTGPRAVLFAPDPPLRGISVYLRDARAAHPGAAVKDIFVVSTATEGRFSTSVPYPPSLAAVVAPPGFAARSRIRSATYSLVRLSAPRPLPIDPAALERNAGPNSGGWGIALQNPR
jgi:hypothetical protein